MKSGSQEVYLMQNYVYANSFALVYSTPEQLLSQQAFLTPVIALLIFTKLGPGNAQP